jgi:serine protease Do
MGFLEKVRSQKLLSVSLLLFTLSIGIIIGTLISTGVNAARPQAGAPDAQPMMIPPAKQLPSNQFVDLAKRLEPSVVNISTEYTPKPARSSGRRSPQSEEEEEDEGMDLFRRFFREGPGGQQRIPPRQFRRQGTGSGFIVDTHGYIMTNYHVVQNADQIKVKMPNDQSEYKAKVIGHDVETDLAVIKVEAQKQLQAVKIGNSDSVQVGDWAIAIGSPFGLEASVTAGIVSATGRDIADAMQFQRFIQTDAAINPGNSGGPLLNINGEVIGINTAIATASGGYQGVGFALPINTAATVYNSIIKTGRMTRGSIGITFRKYENNQQVLKALGFKEGVIVETVNSGGPAEKVGLKPEDVIIAFNGKPVKDGDDLVSKVSSSPIGSQQTITIDRNGKRMDLKVAIGDREEQLAASDDPRFSRRDEGGEPDRAESTGAKFGIRVKQPTDVEREASGVEKGVVITSVDAGSFADEIGLQERDIIVAINRQPVGSIEDIRSIQGKLKSGDAVAFRVMRPSPVPARAGRPQYVGQYVAGTLPAAE